MRQWKRSVVVGAASIFFMAGLASAQSPSAQSPQSTPKMGCQKNFASMDKDGDGAVTREEFMAAPHRRDNPEEIFKARDTNGNGKLTEDEFCSGKGMGYGGKGKGATP